MAPICLATMYNRIEVRSVDCADWAVTLPCQRVGLRWMDAPTINRVAGFGKQTKVHERTHFQQASRFGDDGHANCAKQYQKAYRLVLRTALSRLWDWRSAIGTPRNSAK